MRAARRFRPRSDAPRAWVPEIIHDDGPTLPPLPQRTAGPRPRHATAPHREGSVWSRNPEALRAVAEALRAPGPQPEQPRPPVIWPLPPELPPHSGLPAAQAVAMLPAVKYPGVGEYPDKAPVLDREGYAAAMRHISRITGTSSPYEDAALWPQPALVAGPDGAA
jgi:hypothetical protein